jgi:tetratricopeptide (TPR) repeat protein
MKVEAARGTRRARASDHIGAKLSRLELRVRVDEKDFAFLEHVAFDWALAGFARRGRALAQRWLRKHPESTALRLAEATLALYREPAAASIRLRAVHGDRKVDAAALGAVAAVVRGELHAAVAIASSCGWFLREAGHGNTVVHVVWALNNLGRRAEAVALLRQWRSRHPEVAGDLQSTLLRTEAWLEGTALRFSQAALLLEDAVAIAPTLETRLQREYAEADLAFAYAAMGRFARADAIIGSWGGASVLERPVDAHRALSCASVNTLAGNFARGWSCACRAVRHAESTGNAAVGVHARFWAALSAPPSRSGPALDAFRESVSRVQSVLLAARLQVMDRARSSGRSSLRACPIVERTSRGERRHVLARLWAPLAESIAADLYYDFVQGRTYLKGREVSGMGRVQVRILEALLRSPTFSLAQDALFTAVWGGAFDPLRHGTKLYVALHRFRSFLEAGLGHRPTLHTGEGNVFFAPDLDVRAVDLSSATSPHGASARERSTRLLDLLRACGPLAARDIEGELGLARSQTLAELKILENVGLVRRDGLARRTLWSVESSDLRK